MKYKLSFDIMIFAFIWNTCSNLQSKKYLTDIFQFDKNINYLELSKFISYRLKQEGQNPQVGEV